MHKIKQHIWFMKRLLIFSLVTLFSLTNFWTTQLSSNLYAQTSIPNKLEAVVEPGKPTVIAFWATWCVPCIEELEAISEIYLDRSEEMSFNFIAVSIDDARSSGKVKGFVAGKRWPFKIVNDSNQELMKQLNVSEVPYTFIFDKNGKIVYRHSGYVLGDEEILFKHLKILQNE